VSRLGPVANPWASAEQADVHLTPLKKAQPSKVIVERDCTQIAGCLVAERERERADPNEPFPLLREALLPFTWAAAAAALDGSRNQVTDFSQLN
jgi:hypothetical protein